jgi:hypothetical protein
VNSYDIPAWVTTVPIEHEVADLRRTLNRLREDLEIRRLEDDDLREVAEVLRQKRGSRR